MATKRTLPIDRVMRRLAQEDDCWLWGGALKYDGYPASVEIPGAQRRRLAPYRLTYEYFIAPVPNGLQLDHLCHTNDGACPGGDQCDHRRCCNPWHLEPVTCAVNTLRGKGPAAVAASRDCCAQGHPYTAVNMYVWRNVRICRTCKNERQRLRRPSRAKHRPFPVVSDNSEGESSG